MTTLPSILAIYMDLGMVHNITAGSHPGAMVLYINSLIIRWKGLTLISPYSFHADYICMH